MPRSAHFRPSWRATLFLTLVAALAAVPVTSAAPGEQEPARLQKGDVQRQNPDDRAAGGERLDNDDGLDAEATATLLLTPSRLQPAVGDRVRLTLAVLGADDLRRLPATVRFDPAVLELVALRPGSAWDDGPQPILLHDESRPGEVVIGLGLLDRDATGVSGSVELLDLEFRAIGGGDARLRIERFAAIGAGSKPQPMAALGAEILVR